MGLRHRREERREERQVFGRGGTATQYQMRQKILSIGDDYWIENAEGHRVYRVNGKALRLRHTLDLEDAEGAKLCRVQTRVMHIRDTMDIEGPGGERLARVHKALITPLRERWKVDVEAGSDMQIHGNVVDHDMRSRRATARSQKSPRSGSESATPTGLRSAPTKIRS